MASLWEEESSDQPSPSLSIPGNTHVPLSSSISFPHKLQESTRLHELKESFNDIRADKFAQARKHCNPYELIGRGPFINRSAMKLANIDAKFNLIETSIKNVNLANNSKDSIKEFVFADLCGAPGGFSEYLLWRCERDGLIGRGFGISLGSENGDGDPCIWSLSKSSHDNFTICKGSDGSGDLYVSENILDFANTIKRRGDSNVAMADRVHLVVADGGFARARNKHEQEEVMLRLVVAEVLTSFLILAQGGNFVIKVFETNTSYMASLITLLAESFERIRIVKPITSRPASSERYIICENFRIEEHLPNSIPSKPEATADSTEAATEAATEALWRLHHLLATSNSNISDVWPRIDQRVADYMFDCNQRLLAIQVEACESIILACQYEHTSKGEIKNKLYENKKVCRKSMQMFLQENEGQANSSQNLVIDNIEHRNINEAGPSKEVLEDPLRMPPSSTQHDIMSTTSMTGACAPPASLWSYLDPKGVKQGPFPSDMMFRWLQEGYFDQSATVFSHGPCQECGSINTQEWRGLNDRRNEKGDLLLFECASHYSSAVVGTTQSKEVSPIEKDEARQFKKRKK